jgi:hypothetical protein
VLLLLAPWRKIPRVEVRLQDHGPTVGILDHDALRATKVRSLGGALGADGAGGQRGEGLEVGLGRG